MAQDGSEASVASSSPTPNWCEIHANPFSSWNAISRWPPHNPLPSNSSCDDDISASAPSMDSSDLAPEPAENHLWNQVLLSIGSGGYLHSSHDDGENFLEALSSKTRATEIMFDPAYDYLKKLDSSLEFTNPSNSLNGYSGGLIERERLSNLSDLVGNWSIAPPRAQADRQIAPSRTTNGFINPSIAQYPTSDCSHIKHELLNTPSYHSNGMAGDRNNGYMPYTHEIKGESQHFIGAPQPSLLRPCNTDAIGYGIGLNNSIIGINNKFSSDVSCSNTRNLSDFISFSGYLNKPRKASDSSDSKKQGYETSSSTRGSGRGSGTTSEGKKKRSEDSSDTVLFKKSKHESSTVSSLKMQAPKVKLGDRITALQQIVSPFGKTDTASVLLEAINYISFLQEQIKLLSDPYMKSSANKDHNSWGGLERKEKAETKNDLRSRGLCLVPISFTPQVCRENTGPDYWTPTYRGCLYR